MQHVYLTGVHMQCFPWRMQHVYLPGVHMQCFPSCGNVGYTFQWGIPGVLTSDLLLALVRVRVCPCLL